MEHTDFIDLIESLMEEHRLFEKGWTYTLDRAKRRLGQCDPNMKTISLSAEHVFHHDRHSIKETVLHEIAHALVGPGHGHDEVWQAKAVELGTPPTKCGTHTSNVIHLGHDG